MTSIAVVGGYGYVGARVVRGLVRRDASPIVVAGRDIERAGQFAAAAISGQPRPNASMARAVESAANPMPPYCSGTDNLIRQSRRVRCCTIWSSVRLAGFPDAVAIRRPDGDLTYRELDRLSSQIASALRRLGVAIGDRVGVWLGKSGRATELVARFM